ncbi:hypothetical protein BDZ89DRAFT_1075734 [Hymenopellis radicata]|nr:hypothetical protein BDZ89DRAFT_1075734 [Hymenopellis radicata]
MFPDTSARCGMLLRLLQGRSTSMPALGPSGAPSSAPSRINAHIRRLLTDILIQTFHIRSLTYH